METPLFRDAVKKSLDNDLADMVYNGMASARDAMVLQMLRLARGRVLLPTETTVEGWSPDGVIWFPSEPGTHLTDDQSLKGE